MWLSAYLTDHLKIGLHYFFRLSGISPFYDEDEDKVVSSVQKVKWEFDERTFERVTTEAKDFISKCLIRIPE